jgi:hypothetical protein
LQHTYTLIPTMLPLLETFLEYLLWTSSQCRRHIFWVSSISWKPRPFKADYFFWKHPEVIRSKIRVIMCVLHFGNRFLGQKLLDRERLVSYNIVMVENSIVGTNFRPFSTHSFMWPFLYFHIISLVDWPCGMNEKWKIPLISKKVMRNIFIWDFDIRAFFEPFMPLRHTWRFHNFSPTKPRRAVQMCHVQSLISHKI